jgi:Domain of unknown function (DUF5615)
MLARLLCDENFNENVRAALIRKFPSLEIQRVQDVGLITKSDPEILEWCGQFEFILVSYDVRTMSRFALERVQNDVPMPGVFLISSRTSLREAIDALEMVVACSDPDEWRNLVTMLPL